MSLIFWSRAMPCFRRASIWSLLSRRAWSGLEEVRNWKSLGLEVRYWTKWKGLADMWRGGCVGTLGFARGLTRCFSLIIWSLNGCFAANPCFIDREAEAICARTGLLDFVPSLFMGPEFFAFASGLYFSSGPGADLSSESA